MGHTIGDFLCGSERGARVHRVLSRTYSPQSMPIPAIMGILVGCVVGLLFYRGGRRMGVRFFTMVSMALIFLVAAGLIARSFIVFVEIGLPGGPFVYDASVCCGTDAPFWGFLSIIFGYNATPTPAEFLIYFAYRITLIWVGQVTGTCASFDSPLPSKVFLSNLRTSIKNQPIFFV